MNPQALAAEYVWHASGSSAWALAAVIALVYVELAFMFHKAKLPWWGAVIPIYNLYLVLKLANRPGWWLLLSLIPLVGVLVGLNVIYRLAKAFGHGVFFTIGMLILPPIFFGWMAFSDDRYQFSLVAAPRADFDSWDSEIWR